MEKSLYQTLLELNQSDEYPFHMPGHKRNIKLMDEIYGIDITEIDGYDDMHHPEGILKEAMNHAAKTVGAEHAYFLVNGSTCGILAVIAASVHKRDSILIARNCHKSVYHAVILNELNVSYIYPQIYSEMGINGGVLAEDVEKALRYQPETRLVVITSPTYDGVVSDVKRIAEIVHRHGAILIVDEAHGAHLPFGKETGLPVSAVSLGADAVIQSYHKTLPAMTQCAMLFCNGKRIDSKRLEQFLQIYETSSPSYVFMAGMDAAVRYMKQEGKIRLQMLCKWLNEFYQKAAEWENFVFLTEKDCKTIGGYAFDKTKIVCSVRNRQMGRQLSEMLRVHYHLQAEMSTPDYVVLLTAVGDTEEGFLRLTAAFSEMNEQLRNQSNDDSLNTEDRTKMRRLLSETCPRDAEIVYPPYKAVEMDTEEIEICDAPGRVSAETAYIYPPGSPFLMPGEKITEKHLQLFKYYNLSGMELRGLKDKSGKKIHVIR